MGKRRTSAGTGRCKRHSGQSLMRQLFSPPLARESDRRHVLCLLEKACRGGAARLSAFPPPPLRAESQDRSASTGAPGPDQIGDRGAHPAGMRRDVSGGFRRARVANGRGADQVHAAAEHRHVSRRRRRPGAALISPRRAVSVRRSTTRWPSRRAACGRSRADRPGTARCRRAVRSSS